MHSSSQTFDSSGVEIAYLDVGQGDPVLLIHGFASNVEFNWRSTGWIDFLEEAGFRVIAFDNRGHGRSGKLYDPGAYTGTTMAEDARRLLDALGVPGADVIGYSMGARIAAFLALDHPGRVRSLVLAGLGSKMIHGSGTPEPVAEALMAVDPATITDEAARGFRAFADRTKSDRRALAACIMASRERVPGEKLRALRLPVLVVTGSGDKISGPGKPLADAIPGAEAVEIEGRDHMKTVGDPAFKESVLAFLRRRR